MVKDKQENQVLNRFFEGLCILMALCLFVLPIFYYKSLPEKIPVHFDFYGFPDGYGSKSTLFLLASLGFSIYLIVLFAGLMNDKYYNISFKTTPVGKEKIISLVRIILKVLRINTLLIFNFSIIGIILISKGIINGLGSLSFIIVILMILAPIILMVVRMKNLANYSSKS